MISGVQTIRLQDGSFVYEVVFYKDRAVYLSIFCPRIMCSETRLIKIESSIQNISYVLGRYNTVRMYAEETIEKIQSEIDDDYSDDSLFNISSWGADLTFRELIAMYEENELIKPELQRKYVWDKTEASRFIESILLGLPVPSIFLAQAGSQKLIVDGYQRIMTVYDYVRGIFSADEKVFRLSNSNKINARWRNKAFSELTTDDQRKIRSTTIHAIIFEQRKPANDDTSLYQIFERINTSGRTLNAQEIRNCVYQGSFNRLLIQLNENSDWRTLFGTERADSRMRDIELILRFFVMKSEYVQESKSSQISLKKALNDFMGKHQNALDEVLSCFEQEFCTTILAVREALGINAFRNYQKGKFTRKFHPAIFDAIMVAFYYRVREGEQIGSIATEKHIALLSDSRFSDAISKHTTDIENIKQRIKLATQHLF